MTSSKLFNKISIDPASAVPKYLQLAEQIIAGVRDRRFEPGMMMPSINEISHVTDLSRPTAQKTYKHLQKIKVLDSVPGKCYFITGQNPKSSLHIALYFNKLSAHKKIIYDAFVTEMGEEVSIDFFIYNNEFTTFKSLLDQKGRSYTHFVIIPHFLNNSAEAARLINRIPKQKLILLDKKITGVTGEFGAVYEDFQEDIYTSLTKAADLISKYKAIKIVFPANSYFPQEILSGFRLFCKEHGYSSEIITDLAVDIVRKGDLYITLIETDLVQLVETAVSRKFKIGRDLGIISYNETPIKKIIRNGITTISTDFQQMGKSAAMLILNNSKEQIKVPFALIKRASL